MEYLSLDQRYHKGSLKGFLHLKVQYNHSQSTVAGVECQRSARLGPTLASPDICYLHKAQTQLFRFRFALIHRHFSLLIVKIHKSWVSPHMGWGDMEGRITPSLLIKSRKIRQVKFWVLDEQIKLCSKSCIGVWESRPVIHIHKDLPDFQLHLNSWHGSSGVRGEGERKLWNIKLKDLLISQMAQSGFLLHFHSSKRRPVQKRMMDIFEKLVIRLVRKLCTE